MPRTFEQKSPIEQEMYVITQCNKQIQKLSPAGQRRAAAYILAAVEPSIAEKFPGANIHAPQQIGVPFAAE
jgi:hypothetical protein